MCCKRRKKRLTGWACARLLLPVQECVTVLAGSSHCAFMYILVAILTVVVFKVLKLSGRKTCILGTREMALGAFGCLVLAFKFILRVPVMVEIDFFTLPSVHVVTGLAFIAQLRFVRVFVTIPAKIVLSLERCIPGSCVLGIGMTLSAFYVSVFAFEFIF